MMKNNIKQPVIIILSVIVMLFIISSTQLPNITFITQQKKVDILDDIRLTTPNKNKKNTAVVNTTQSTKQPFDSTIFIDYGSNQTDALRTFLAKLSTAKTDHKKVRIAYFGDSFIESDNITDELRRKLQALYGGNGIGFLPIQSVVASQYRSIKFFTAGSWVDYNFRSNPYKLPLGLTGHIFYTSGNATTEFTVKNEALFNDIKLYTGMSNKPTSKVYVTKDGREEYAIINNNSLVNETIINNNIPIKDIRIASADVNLPVYGVSIESSEGVFIDNYSFRGNNSVLTNQLSKDIMQAFNQYLQYDLIILHYGLNAVEHDKEKFIWFENSMNKLIETVKKGFANTPILLISTSDFAYKYNGKYSSEYAVPFMVATQQKIAAKNKVSFWDLYSTMGGENTMVNWVEGDTVLAYRDYIHVNEKGAKRIANLLFTKLMASKKFYEQYAKN